MFTWWADKKITAAIKIYKNLQVQQHWNMSSVSSISVKLTKSKFNQSSSYFANFFSCNNCTSKLTATRQLVLVSLEMVFSNGCKKGKTLNLKLNIKFFQTICPYLHIWSKPHVWQSVEIGSVEKLWFELLYVLSISRILNEVFLRNMEVLVSLRASRKLGFLHCWKFAKLW